MLFTVEQLLAITQGTLVQGSRKSRVKGVSTNSKTVKKDELFIAIPGERFDGHDFIAEVAGRDVSVVIISKENISLPTEITAIRVADTVKALGLIARAYRDQFSIPIIGITGSAGKTTTKEMLARVLKVKFKVHYNKGTENNHIGVPLTLLKLKPSHELAIIEMGTNRFGDIPWLAQVARPTMAVMTNIGESHLALLKTPADVFKEKSALVKGTVKAGIVIVNNDDSFLKTLPRRDKAHKFVTYGIKRPADFRAQDIRITADNKLFFQVNARHPFVLKTPVMANVYNALVAISCGRAFNISYNSISKSLKGFRGHQSRQVVERIASHYLIDDTYNANPVSFRSALDTLSQFTVKGRKILVCADMLELGERSPDLHAEIGKHAAASGVAAVFSFGNFSRFVGEAAQKIKTDLVVVHSESLEALQEKLAAYCRPGDAVLVKGSRGMRMERLVEFLKTRLRSI